MAYWFLVQRARPVLVSARDGLLARPRLFGVILSIGILGGGAVAAIRSLWVAHAHSESVLPLPALSTLPSILTWTGEARTPAALQASGLSEFLLSLMTVAWTVLALAALSIVGLYAAQAGPRGSELRVRRAVGAARRVLGGALALEAAATWAVMLIAGVLFGSALLRVSTALWSETAVRPPLAPAGVSLVLLGSVAIGCLVTLSAMSRGPLRERQPLSLPLSLPVIQLGVCFAILAAGVSLRQRSDSSGLSALVPIGSGVLVQLGAESLSPAERAAEYRQIVRGLTGSGNYDTVSLTSPGQAIGLGTVDFAKTDCGQCLRGGVLLRFDALRATYRFVSPDTFRASNVKLLEGRVLTEADAWEAPRVAVVNRHLALRHFENGEAIGRDIYLSTGWPARPYRVIGVVDDQRSSALGAAAQPYQAVYLSALQHPPEYAELLLRRRGVTLDIKETRAVVAAALGSGTNIVSVVDEEIYFAAQRRPFAWLGAWFGAIGGVGAVVAIAGMVTIMLLWINSIAGELALRRAVGATRWSVLGFVALRGLGVGVAGMGLGLLLYVAGLWSPLSLVVSGLPWWPPAAAWAMVALLVAACIGAAVAAAIPVTLRPPGRSLD